MAELIEYWLAGPVESITGYLQPVAHALLQAKREVSAATEEFPNNQLWVRPAGMASVGFHLQHLSGVLDRLFTYAEGKQLSDDQLAYLKAECISNEAFTVQKLLENFQTQIDQSIKKLKGYREEDLLQARGVGRKQIPSTVLGLLFHSAEHTMRHTGQLLVTISVIKNTGN